MEIIVGLNKFTSLLIQSLVLSICSFTLAISWSKLISPIVSNFRRDHNIVGQNLILVSISFLGIFAFAYDQPEFNKIITVSNQLIFLLFFLLIIVWIGCIRIVRSILQRPVEEPRNIIIIGSRYLINLAGMITVVMCRFLLTCTLINL